MKMKIKKYYSLLNCITTTPKFKVLFLLLFVISFYGSFVLGSAIENFIDSIFVAFQFPIFNMIFFLLIGLNTYNTCTTISKKFSYYIIRLESKKAYYIEQMKIAFIVNIYFLILFFIIYFSFQVFFNTGNFLIHNYNTYNVNNLVFSIFYLSRYSILLLLIMNIMTMLLLNYNDKVVLTFSFIFSIGFLVTPVSDTTLNTFSINYWIYFNGINYSSFITEINYSILFLSFLSLFNIVLFLISKYRKGINIS
jgi:hypothetical protein